MENVFCGLDSEEVIAHKSNLQKYLGPHLESKNGLVEKDIKDHLVPSSPV